jgi:hypothetical protein
VAQPPINANYRKEPKQMMAPEQVAATLALIHPTAYSRFHRS